MSKRELFFLCCFSLVAISLLIYFEKVPGEPEPKKSVAASVQDPTPEEIYRNFQSAVLLDFLFNVDGKIITGNASGFLVEIDGEPFVATAGHVVLRNDPKSIVRCTAYFKEKIAPCDLKLVDYDMTTGDCGLFALTNTFKREVILAACAKIGSSKNLEVGQRVYAIGTDVDMMFNFAQGNVKNLDFGTLVFNFLSARSATAHQYLQPQAIVHDAAVSSGSSGGPLLNKSGEVIGMNQMIRLVAGSLQWTVASPIDDVMATLVRLKREGHIEYPNLPAVVSHTDLMTEFELFSLGAFRPKESGVMVLFCDREPTEDNLMAGDIIRTCNGQPIKKPNDFVRACLIGGRIGEALHLIVDRKGERKEIDLVLEAMSPMAKDDCKEDVGPPDQEKKLDNLFIY